MIAISSLILSGIALIFAAVAAINQLTSTKRPILDVMFSNQKRVVLADPTGTGGLEKVIASSLLVRITNRGHDPMLNPRVIDTTEGHHISRMDTQDYSMPHEIENNRPVEVATCYSLANDYDREISIIWEEFALFHRNPKTRGLRYVVDAEAGLKMREAPIKEWRRGRIFGSADWRQSRRRGSFYFLTAEQAERLNKGARWKAVAPIAETDVHDRAQIIVYSLIGFEPMVNGEIIEKNQYEHWLAQGKKLPRD